MNILLTSMGVGIGVFIVIFSLVEFLLFILNKFTPKSKPHLPPEQSGN